MGDRAKKSEWYGAETFGGSAAAWVGSAKGLMLEELGMTSPTRFIKAADISAPKHYALDLREAPRLIDQATNQLANKSQLG